MLVVKVLQIEITIFTQIIFYELSLNFQIKF